VPSRWRFFHSFDHGVAAPLRRAGKSAVVSLFFRWGAQSERRPTSGKNFAARARMNNRRRAFAVVALGGGLLLGGCGTALVQVGADVAAGGMKGGTHSVASGQNVSAGDGAALAAGVALMAAGYKLTPPDQRQAPTPLVPPQMFNAAQPPSRQ
jgi:hypothetical protein